MDDPADAPAPISALQRRLAQASSDRVRGALAGALLVALTLAAYFPALAAGFVFDDEGYVWDNPTLSTVAGLRRIWFEPTASPQYYPLTFTSFWVEYHLWGLQPLGYHLVNILLHGVNAVLLWQVLRRLRVPGAWIAAALFALHPLHVESVAFVAERKNVLSCGCALGALLAYLNAVSGNDNGRIRWRWYLAAGALFLAAVSSKTVACTLPAVLLLLQWWQRGSVDRRTWRMLAPMFILGGGMAAVTIWMEKYHVGAQGNEWALSIVERLLLAGRAFWFYPGKLLWPYPLVFIYPRWSSDAQVWWQYLFPAAALALLLALYAARARLGRGPVVAVLCYAVMLSPALGFVDVYLMRFSYVADHFAYQPDIALIVLGTAAGATLLQRAGTRRHLVSGVAFGLGLLVLGLLTAEQCTIYRDQRTLWADTMAKNPACWMAHNNLGVALADAGDFSGAIMHYERALQLKPDYEVAHNSLGKSLWELGRQAEAMPHFAEAVRLRPTYPEAQNNFAAGLAAEGKNEEAILHYRQALRSKPNYAKACNNLGVALVALGRTDEAIAQYAEALRLHPANPEAYNNLGAALAMEGRTAEAIAQFRNALQLKPDLSGARANLSRALQAQQQHQ